MFLNTATALKKNNNAKIITLIMLFWFLLLVSGFLRVEALYPFINTLFLINLVVSFVYLLNYICRNYNILSFIKLENTIGYGVFFIILSFVGCLFVLIFINQNKTIYFWDQVGYWKWSILFNEKFYDNNLYESLRWVYSSINNDDYNLLPILLISIPLKLFGMEFSGYVSSIYIIYIIPFSILTSLFINKILFDINKFSWKSFCTVCMAVALFMPNITPMLNGYLDSIGIVLIILIMIIVYHEDFIIINYRRNLLVSFLLVSLSLSRRWFAYWVIAFFLSLVLTYLIKLIKEKKIKFEYFSKFLVNVFVIGSTALLILLLFFKDFLIRGAFNNYSVLYSAYKVGGLFSNINQLFEHFGIPIIVVSAIGLLYGCFLNKTRYFTIFVVLQSVIVFLMFLTTQSFGIHHYYLLSPSILYLFIMGLIFVINSNNMRFLTIKFISVLIFLMLLFYLTYFESNNKIIKYIKPILTQENYYPRIRNDVDTVHSIYNYVNDLTKDSGKKIYILSSSPIFTEDTLRNIKMPHTIDALPLLERTMHIDKRDGFPNQLLLSDIVLIADPIQYHLAPESQQIIGVLAENILENKGYGMNYEKINEFILDGGVAVKVYEKKNGFNKESYNILYKQFYNAYPNYPPLYNINKLASAINNISVGDKFGTVVVNNDIIRIHPGENKDTSFDINVSDYKKMSFDVQMESLEFGEINIKIMDGDEILTEKYVESGISQRIELDVSQQFRIRIVVNPGKNGPGYDTTLLKNIQLS